MRAMLSIAAVSLLLAACGQQTSEPSAPATPASAERPRSPAVVGPILITFNENGAGEINSATPLNVHSISGVFPDATVRPAAYGEADAQIITVRRPDGLILDLHPGGDPKRVGRIFGRGGPVTGPLGEKIGADWETLGFAAETCARGQDDMSHALVCYRAGAPRLGYVVDLPGFEGPDDQTPEHDFLVGNARLSAFMWTADTV